MPVYAEKNDGDPEDNKRVQFDNRDIKLADLSANHKELGYEFNKKQFHDAKRIRYNWTISKLPSTCVCGSRFDVPLALSCNKGSVILRHNEIRDLTSVALAEVQT